MQRVWLLPVLHHQLTQPALVAAGGIHCMVLLVAWAQLAEWLVFPGQQCLIGCLIGAQAVQQPIQLLHGAGVAT